MQQSADMDAAVVIYGESGTGKELAARHIHRLSPRSGGRFVPVNCGAVPEAIFESEFFGYKKGAFSGAEKNTEGYLDVADGGTLFLDEVGEISLSGQVKLLRVIDGRGYTPVGGRREKHPNLRIIAATNKDLKKLVENGDMREDFFFRIHVFPITMPPLRDRKEDIPILIDWLIRSSGFPAAPPPGGDALRRLLAYDWPGNVRELQNIIHRYMSTRNLDFLSTNDRPAPAPAEDPPTPGQEAQTLRAAVHEFERRYIRRILDRHHWHRAKVAKILGVDRRTLLRKIRTLGID
ncbi:sigma-54 interaction domain-containing protein [Dethiosulfatarculus sandiegensis]|uniref:sigma-54 interaction domain-containing protein n=1 Tax=Dethiosulfatarculus sandiegensis TaxID=1429043 RepID=UPI0022B218E1|nr:sigma 54-interacting transcriptional regulator [Dethiosulfatarculus sandiegensis]